MNKRKIPLFSGKSVTCLKTALAFLSFNDCNYNYTGCCSVSLHKSCEPVSLHCAHAGLVQTCSSMQLLNYVWNLILPFQIRHGSCCCGNEDFGLGLSRLGPKRATAMFLKLSTSRSCSPCFWPWHFSVTLTLSVRFLLSKLAGQESSVAPCCCRHEVDVIRNLRLREDLPPIGMLMCSCFLREVSRNRKQIISADAKWCV